MSDVIVLTSREEALESARQFAVDLIEDLRRKNAALCATQDELIACLRPFAKWYQIAGDHTQKIDPGEVYDAWRRAAELLAALGIPQPTGEK